MAVADEHALLIADMAVQARINLGVLAAGRVVGPASGECLRQAARRVRHRRTAHRQSHCPPPAPDTRPAKRPRPAQPGHFHRPAGLQHHHRARVGGHTAATNSSCRPGRRMSGRSLPSVSHSPVRPTHRPPPFPPPRPPRGLGDIGIAQGPRRCRRAGPQSTRLSAGVWRTRPPPDACDPPPASTSPTTSSQPSSKKVRPLVQPVQASATSAPSTQHPRIARRNARRPGAGPTASGVKVPVRRAEKLPPDRPCRRPRAGSRRPSPRPSASRVQHRARSSARVGERIRPSDRPSSSGSKRWLVQPGA